MVYLSSIAMQTKLEMLTKVSPTEGRPSVCNLHIATSLTKVGAEVSKFRVSCY